MPFSDDYEDYDDYCDCDDCLYESDDYNDDDEYEGEGRVSRYIDALTEQPLGDTLPTNVPHGLFIDFGEPLPRAAVTDWIDIEDVLILGVPEHTLVGASP